MGSETPHVATIEAWYRTWLPRIAAVTVVALAVGNGAIWVFRATSGFMITLLLSLFIAFALLPAVETLSARGWRRGLATGVVMAVAAIAAFVFTAALLGVAINQTIRLVRAAPSYLDTATMWLNDTFGLDLVADRLIADLELERSALQDLATDAANGVLGVATSAIGVVFQVLTIALFVFYILADLPRLRNAVMRRLTPELQQQADTVIGITISKVGGYVYSRSLLAIASAVFHFTAFRLIGVPYALALAMWVGVVSQFVPTVGTYLAGIFPLVIALAENPPDAIWVLVAILAYQQIENYALAPRVTANTMKLHPAVAFGSAIIGASLLGGVGALLALPAAATIVALVETYADHYEVIASGTIESPASYESRMVEVARARGERRTSRFNRVREWASIDDD
ncbi:MAG: AI-2E family transporter [Acidimicrobiia bacterium]|nr:AI-2E family transporter [Acidimicrobiia bacterium]